MSRDYFQQRRARRRMTNVFLVGTLSLAFGWVLTRQPETPAFPIRASNQNTSASGESSQKTSGGSGSSQIPAGPYALQEIPDAAVHDDARGSDIHVRLLFPKTTGRFKVIVYSPDDHDSQECCDSLIRDWASHGYAIVQLTRVAVLQHTDKHAGTSLQSVRLKRTIRARGSVTQSETPLHVSSVIDSLAALQTRFPAIRGKLDAANIGVAGHGTGAVAAEGIAGAVLELPGRPHSNLADPRVRAVLCISPQGPGQSGLTEHSFDQLALPYLGITGGHDLAPRKFAAPAWHKAPFEGSQPGDKYELFVQGDNESSLVSEGSSNPADSTQNVLRSGATATQIHAATLAFWDAYLKHDVAAKRYLQSDALVKTSRGTLTLERR
jgi:predicted dienelactone hydrolase